jgi:hypothetical protein
MNTEKKESEWAKRMKEKIRAKEEEKAKEENKTMNIDETQASAEPNEPRPELNLSADELMKEKIKNKLKEMKMNSAKVLFSEFHNF